MEYREIVAVTGLSGLYQLVTTKSDGAIVRSVADKTTKFISARQHNVTPLESIEVYTTGDNVRLNVVFRKMIEGEAAVAPASVNVSDAKAVKAYFKQVFPEFDEDRVYVSDMKKMLKWFEILKANDLLRFEEEAPAAEEAEPVAAAPVEEVAAEEPTEKPKKTARKKKADTEDTPAEDTPADAAAEEKPAKKTARKKKTEE